jgi:O-antigen ligase
VPLPRALFLAVAPGADNFLRQFQLGYGLVPSDWHAVTIDSTATLTALVLFVGFALFVTGLMRVLDRIRLVSLVRRLSMLGMIVALLGLMQRAVGPIGAMPDGRPVPLIYGFWLPHEGGSPFGPFVNHNHFAGWMIMVLPLALGYACALAETAFEAHARDWGRWSRWLLTPSAGPLLLALFAVLAMGTALVLTGSRSGIMGFALGVVIVAVVIARRMGGWAGRVAALLALITLVAGAIQWAGADATVNRFMRASVDMPGRLTAWRDTLRIVSDFPWVGTGLGNYGRAMLIYQTGDRSQIFFEAHNDYLQLLAEGGWLVAVPAVCTLAAVAVAIRRRFAARRDDILTYWTRVGAMAGLAAIAVQSSLEFSLQLMGNLLVFGLLIGLAGHASRAPRASILTRAEEAGA